MRELVRAASFITGHVSRIASFLHIGPPMLVSNAAKTFDAAGTPADEEMRRRLREFPAGCADFVRSTRR